MHKKLKYNITLCTSQTKTVYEKGKTGKNNKTKMQFCCKDLPIEALNSLYHTSTCMQSVERTAYTKCQMIIS